MKKKEVVEFDVKVEDGLYHVAIMPRNPVTTCEMYYYDNDNIFPGWVLVGYGVARCKHNDKYDVETGCRMALASMVRGFISVQEEREAIWKKYLELFPVSERKQPEKKSVWMSMWRLASPVAPYGGK